MCCSRIAYFLSAECTAAVAADVEAAMKEMPAGASYVEGTTGATENVYDALVPIVLPFESSAVTTPVASPDA
jgi:hypothetical protein